MACRVSRLPREGVSGRQGADELRPPSRARRAAGSLEQGTRTRPWSRASPGSGGQRRARARRPVPRRSSRRPGSPRRCARPARGHPQSAEPPSAVADDVEHAHMQARGRHHAEWRHPLPRLLHLSPHELHRLVLPRPRRLLDGHLEASSSARISSAASRRTREARIDASSTASRPRSKPRNSRPVPAPTTAWSHVLAARRRRSVHRHLAPGAGVRQLRPADRRRGPQRRMWSPSAASVNSRMSSVRFTTARGRPQVAQRARHRKAR